MKLLIWDFDGTLGWREGGWTGTLLEAIRACAPEKSLSPEQVRPYLQSGFPWQAPETPHPDTHTPEAWWDRLDPLFERACGGLGFSPSDSRNIAHQVRRVYPNLSRFRLFDDSLPALAQLSAHGWTHALLSNHVPELPAMLRHLGLAESLACMFNSAETGYEKPHPQAFRLALAAFPHAHAVYMIGDNPTADIEGAASVGLPGILVRKPHPGVPYFCQDLNQLVEFLDTQERTDLAGF
jgi:putative hydrolase of the HAD superfamily